MEVILFLLLIMLLLFSIVAFIGTMILLYDAVLDVIEKRNRGRHKP